MSCLIRNPRLPFAAALITVATMPAFAEITPLGDAFAVTSVSGILPDFVVARDAAGDFVISWDLQTGTNTKSLYAQVFNASGVAHSTVILVGTESIPTSYSQASVNSVGMDDAGNFVVAWPQASGNSSNPLQIVAQRFSVDGATLGQPVKVSPRFKAAKQTVVSMNHVSGDFAVSWTTEKFLGIGTSGPGGCGSGICFWSTTTTSYARLYKSSGTPLTSVFVTQAAQKQTGSGSFNGATQIKGTNSFADSIALNTGDDLIATFTSYTDNQTASGSAAVFSVIASRFDASGAAIGSSFTVSTNTPVYGANSHVGVDDAGGFLINWNGSANIGGGQSLPYYARYAADGSLQGSISAVPAPPSQVYGQSVFANVGLAPSGAYVTTWNLGQGASGNTAIPLFPQGQFYDSSGNALDEVFSATDDSNVDNSRGSAVAIDAAGEPVMVWLDFQSDAFGNVSTSTLMAQRLSAP